MVKTEDWWTDFFPAFRPLFGLVSKATSNAEANYIVKKLGLRKGSRFLDCPCGIGRISIPLAKKGIRVTGVDITQSYLDELAAKSKRLGFKINLVQSDMRRIKFNSEFDAAGNIWTSFGYFEKESDNQVVLARIFQALKPGGKFMLHVISRDFIIRNFTPVDVTEIDGMRIIDSRHFDPARSASVSEWIFMKGGREKKIPSVLRMYSFHELIAMMRKAGFVNIEGFGSVKDEPIGINSRMIFVIGTRPKRRVIN